MRPKLHQEIDSDEEKYSIVLGMDFNNLITIKTKVYLLLNMQIIMNKVIKNLKD